jgi:DNA-binding response OmpR family regulator
MFTDQKSDKSARSGAREGRAPRGIVTTAQGSRLVSILNAGEADDRNERGPLSVAILDRDSGFLAVLVNRLDRLGWERRTLPARVTAKTLGSMDADALIVDVAILGARRWKWLARFCEQRPDVRVIVCTGPSTVGERVCALRAGADDWLGKPCHPEELLARVEAIVGYRRPFAHTTLDSVWIGEIEIRPHQFQAYVNGSSLGLTQREYQLLAVLAGREGEIVAREAIYQSMWRAEMPRHDRSVDVLVHRVRRKLERASSRWSYVHTHYRAGYRLTPEPVAALPDPVQLPRRAPEPVALAA